MTDILKLMAILAHPDDESLGAGGVLAKYAAEGIETFLVTATRGERGWFGDEREYPGLEALGQMREAELHAAAKVLSIRSVDFLGYLDGELDQANPAEVVAKIVGHLRHVKPDVVVTFGPDGSYGHPDHIAISQFTTAAIVEAASPDSLYSYWRTVWKAVRCHQTQLPAYHLLEGLPEEQHKALWGCQTFYRTFSLVNGGRTVEHDLFEGLRF